MDDSVKPGDNFFLYANGNWLKTAVIPPDRSLIGTLQSLRILSEKRMNELAASLDTRPYDQLSGEEKKLRDLYDAFLDQRQINARGLEPVKKTLEYIAGLKTRQEVATAMGRPDLGIPSPFSDAIGSDVKDSNKYQVTFFQGGLGLPDREYYLKDDPALAKIRDAYKAHLARLFSMMGLSNPQKRAAAVYDVERQMAEVEWPREDDRDADKTYNPMTLKEIKALAPDFPWDALIAAGGITPNSPTGPRIMIVAEKSAFPKLAKIFARTPLDVWRDYAAVHYVDSNAAYLPEAFDKENFAFYGTALQGNAAQLPRATRAAHLLDDLMGEALGKLYVAKYFPPQAKAKAEKLVNNLLEAYDADIRTLAWMTPATREKALYKLHHFTVKIGYPDHWRDYSKLVIKRDDLIGDVQRYRQFDWDRNLTRIDDPVDKSEWTETPPTVDAYDNFLWNEIAFPAAILQPPLFDPQSDDSVNYGGIGAVIGHEISHGFDDQGSKYDATGALNNWWTPADRAAFETRVKALGEQYDSYEPLPGLHVNGANTMGENIADNAGLAIALKAYHISLNGKPAPVVGGFTGDQRFYLAFAQIWRAKLRDDTLRQQIISSEHSPQQFRVIGATRNQDAWYSAFDVKPGDKFYLPPEQRVHFW
jgi:putative endopeptidase